MVKIIIQWFFILCILLIMQLLDSKLYCEDIKKLASNNLNYSNIQNKCIMITWASGLIWSFLIDTIMYLNKNDNLNCHIYAIGLRKNISERFLHYIWNDLFTYISHDVNLPLDIDIKADFVIHLASNTHPILYATYPISTITTNIIGTKNMLDYAVKSKSKRFLFASSNEIYGENKWDVEFFDESYCWYIDSNTLRAWYPESKRCGEALCQAYIEEKKMDIVIARFTRTYWPTLLKDDSKAISQFIFKALNNEDIVLKSNWSQYYSFTYVYDAVYGLLTVLLSGNNWEAYNISNIKSDVTLANLANIVASTVNKKVIFDIPNEIESKGFSKATKARLDNAKLKTLGFSPVYDIKTGVERTISILKEIMRK